jgi:hypothetical protein
MGVMDFLDPGDLLGFGQDSRVAKANAALKEAKQAADDASSQNRGLYNQYLNKVQGTYGDTAGKYSQYLQNLENQEVYNPGEFSFDKNVEDYYSKFANQRANQAMNAITNSRANAGDMFSSDYLNAVAAKQQALASEEADKAYDRYMQERGQALNEFSTNANLQNQAYQNQYNKNRDLLGQAQNALDNTTNAYGSYISNLAGQNNIDAQNAANFAQQMAANENSKKGLLGRIFG